MEKIFALAGAIKSGECLANPEAWKNRQTLLNAFLSFIGLVPIMTNIEMSEVEINNTAYFLSASAGLINMYITNATSKKVGI